MTTQRPPHDAVARPGAAHAAETARGVHPSGVERLYGWLTIVIGAEVAAVQVLAFLGWFTAWRALALGGVLAVALGKAYFAEPLPEDAPKFHWPKPLTVAAWFAAAVAAVLVLEPLLIWPRTVLGGSLLWDVIWYHLPKAIDLVQRGTMWNLALPYGQYPLGWEGLAAVLMGLFHTAAVLGPLTALTVFWAGVGMWALLRREAGWPDAAAALAAAGVWLGGELVQHFNPWVLLFFVPHYNVGKNDIFAAAAVLAAWYHLPLGFGERQPRWHKTGVALSALVAFATKPYAAAAVVLLVVLAWWLSPEARPRWRKHDMAYLGLASVGLLWLVRNLVLLHQPTTVGGTLWKQVVLRYVVTPDFWHPVPKKFVFMVLASAVALMWGWRQRKARPGAWGFVAVFLLFWVTPASARYLDASHQAIADWRFGFASLYLLPVVLGVWASAVARRWPVPWLAQPEVAWLGAVLLVLGALWVGWQARAQLRYFPPNARVLEDPYERPVGVDGYRSVFDYIHREVRHAVIQVENVPFYYVYDPQYTDFPVKPKAYPGGKPEAVPQPVPDHYLACRSAWRSWWPRHPWPARVETLLSRGWKVLYRDQECVLLAK